MAKKSNWDRLSKRSPGETMKNRDVYEQQQLERSEIGNKQSPWVNIIFFGIIALLITVMFYGILCVGEFGYSRFDMFRQSHSEDANMTEVEALYQNNVVKISKTDSQGNFSDFWIIDENSDKKPDDGNGYREKKKAYEVYTDMLTKRGDLDGERLAEAQTVIKGLEKESFFYYFRPNWWKLLLSLLCLLIAGSALLTKATRLTKAVNILETTDDILVEKNDQHIALPEEVMRKFDWFPDVGAHSDVQFSSMISHVALKNKGLKSIKVAKRAKHDIVNEDGEIEIYEGEVLRDEDGNILYETKPLIDTEFMDALFEASGNPSDDKKYNKKYDATTIPYNPDGKDRDKLGKYKTVADLINEDWDFPYYEPQRPGGAFIVDTAPVNTMVLAITRAGKGKFSPCYRVICDSF